MIQGSSHFRKVLTVLSVTYLLHVNAATDNQHVINEVNKLEKFVKTLETPPEMIDALLKQVETHCHKNRTVDQTALTNASRCMEQHLNVSQVANDMRAAIPEGKMDNVFRDMCVKWPKIKACMSEFFGVVDDCWNKGDKVSKFVDEIVRFYCGDDNGGERIAIFFAEGGLECIQKHGNDVKECVEQKQDVHFDDLGSIEDGGFPDLTNKLDDLSSKIPKKDQICETLEHLKECTTKGLKNCSDPTPENLMSSMLMQVGKGLECKLTESRHGSLSGANVSGSQAAISYLSSLLLIGVFGVLAF